MKLYRHNSNGLYGEQGTTVPSNWHGSNRSNSKSNGRDRGKAVLYGLSPALEFSQTANQ